MSLRTIGQFHESVRSFNMTPVIDIVFLLIIFFLVVCQFIDAENFPVSVPDDCAFASSACEPGVRMTTITVMRNAEGEVDFAVGAEQVEAIGGTDLAERIARLVDSSLEGLPLDSRVVTLRIDKDICFAEAQYVLAAVAQCSATDVQLAALKSKCNGIE